MCIAVWRVPPSSTACRTRNVCLVSRLFPLTPFFKPCYSKLLSQHDITQLLDNDMDEAEMEDIRDAEAVCRRLLEWDASADPTGTRIKLAAILGLN